MKRSICTGLAASILAGGLTFAVAGCGGSSELAKVPETPKAQNPETDMPGYKEMQDKMKNGGR